MMALERRFIILCMPGTEPDELEGIAKILHTAFEPLGVTGIISIREITVFDRKDLEELKQALDRVLQETAPHATVEKVA